MHRKMISLAIDPFFPAKRDYNFGAGCFTMFVILDFATYRNAHCKIISNTILMYTKDMMDKFM